jgi:hypothetical protein
VGLAGPGILGYNWAKQIHGGCTMKKTNVKLLVLAALFLALGLVLPFLTGQIPEIGAMLCPIWLFCCTHQLTHHRICAIISPNYIVEI